MEISKQQVKWFFVEWAKQENIDGKMAPGLLTD